jgi:hypothetical protein
MLDQSPVSEGGYVSKLFLSAGIPIGEKKMEWRV